MAIDISISLDPISWAIEIFLIIYLAKWFRFEKKEAKKQARANRKTKKVEHLVKLQNEINIKGSGSNEEPDSMDA